MKKGKIVFRGRKKQFQKTVRKEAKWKERKKEEPRMKGEQCVEVYKWEKRIGRK